MPIIIMEHISLIVQSIKWNKNTIIMYHMGGINKINIISDRNTKYLHCNNTKLTKRITYSSCTHRSNEWNHKISVIVLQCVNEKKNRRKKIKKRFGR